MPMSYSQASARIKQYFGSEDLLACLQNYQSIEHEPPRDVRVAYFTLMAGFTEMMG